MSSGIKRMHVQGALRQFLLSSSVKQFALSGRSHPELQSTAVDGDQAVADDAVKAETSHYRRGLASPTPTAAEPAVHRKLN